MSAYSLARWLHSQGHDVGVLCTAQTETEQQFAETVDGLIIYRLHWPRPYPMYQFAQAKRWQKPIWHLQDHFAFANTELTDRVLDHFKPEFINVHVIQGIGYNALNSFAKRNLPVAYCLHDMGLACVRMSMFRGGQECASQCTTCLLSSKVKSALVRKLPRVGFYSPSRANLLKVSQFFPIRDYPHTSLLNPNRYPRPSVARTESETLRLLYAGRLQETKGVRFLLEAARALFRRLGTHAPFHLKVVGNGPQESALHADFKTEPWCSFPGFLSQEDLSNEMLNSDVLCVPSIWFENSPGVVVHALGLGLPVLGSNNGGLPELIEDGQNGRLLPVGDSQSWQAELENLLGKREILVRWRQYALTQAEKFDQPHLGQLTLAFFRAVMDGSEPESFPQPTS